MKVSRRDAQSGPIRWLLRISGWCCLIIGIFSVIVPEDSPFSSFSMGHALVGGVFLVIFDLLLPDPARKARRMKKKLKKLYRKLYKALPSNSAAFEMAKRTSRFSDLDIKIYSNIAKALFMKAPVKETLSYIYKLNPDAIYEICIDVLNTSKK